MQPDLHTQRDHQFRALEREYRRLHRARWDAPLVAVAQPWQRPDNLRGHRVRWRGDATAAEQRIEAALGTREVE